MRNIKAINKIMAINNSKINRLMKIVEFIKEIINITIII
jgi:hypothetical protein